VVELSSRSIHPRASHLFSSRNVLEIFENDEEDF